MRIVGLHSENVKRIVAVDIVPTGAVTTIGGKNKAGKTSVLDAISMALGGERLMPPEPIRKGESEGIVRLDLGDYVVVRKFKRDYLTCDCEPGTETSNRGSTTPIEHLKDCASHKFGPVRSTLTVESKDGALYKSPQTLLNKLYGELTFDPMAFATDDPPKQRETLRRLVKLDTSELDEEIKTCGAERATFLRQVRSLTEQANAMPYYGMAPVKEIPLTELEEQMESFRAAVSNAQMVRQTLHNMEQVADAAAVRFKTAEDNLAKAKLEFNRAKETNGRAIAEGLEALKNLHVAEAKIPSVDDVKAKLVELEETNRQVRANKARFEVMTRSKQATKEANELRDKAEEVKLTRELLISKVKFPVKGLGFGEHGVTLNGLPFEQASTSEQIEVSVAIGIAMNPNLRVLLVRDGNALDEDSLKILAGQAEAADAQIWMEYVTSDKSGVSVFIEDGSIK